MVRDRCRAVAAASLVPVGTPLVLLLLATLGVACAPGEAAGTDDDTNGVTGELVTYVADHKDGTSEWWHALRTKEGREIRLDRLGKG